MTLQTINAVRQAQDDVNEARRIEKEDAHRLDVLHQLRVAEDRLNNELAASKERRVVLKRLRKDFREIRGEAATTTAELDELLRLSNAELPSVGLTVMGVDYGSAGWDGSRVRQRSDYEYHDVTQPKSLRPPLTLQGGLTRSEAFDFVSKHYA